MSLKKLKIPNFEFFATDVDGTVEAVIKTTLTLANHKIVSSSVWQILDFVFTIIMCRNEMCAMKNVNVYLDVPGK